MAATTDDSRMRILIVVPWEREVGGVVSLVSSLARYLHAHGQKLVFFHPDKILFLKKTVTNLGLPGIRLRLTMPFGKPHPLLRMLVFPFSFPIVIAQLLWFIRSRRIQIINVHYPMNSFSYFAVCRCLLPVRLVTSIHGSDAFPNGKPRDSYSRAFRFLLHSSDLIVLPSDAYRNKLVGVFPEIKERAVFIHNGVDPAQFHSALGGQSDDRANRYMVCIASLVELKGIDVLLRAVKPIFEGDPALELLLVGDGPMRAELQQLARSLGISNQTKFLGQKTTHEVASLLRGCELFVLPSRAESFGIVVLEALACGKAVVASAVGGIPEIIEHEKNGILVEPDNPTALTAALRKVLYDKDLKKQLGENGYIKLMERFSLNHTGAAYTSAFDRLLRHADSLPVGPPTKNRVS